MQAIVTKFIGPTNHRGARVKATAQAGTVTIAWDDAQGIDGNHYAAMRAFCLRYGWPVYNVLGWTADQEGVFLRSNGA